jgi:spermidine synthase
LLETNGSPVARSLSPEPASAAGIRESLVLLALLFTLTGATALLVEQVFEKLLSTLVGASTPAAATVLAVYFAGLTLGGILYARTLQGRIRRPLKVYALFEGIVAFWALFLYFAFDTLISFFTPFLALGHDRFWLLEILRVAVAACWILPVTIPMGASFPAIVDALEQFRVPNHGRAMSAFYAFNLLGAILGAVFGPFQTFPRWGLDGTLLFIFLVNFTVLVIALTFASLLPPAAPVAEHSSPLPDGSRSADGMELLIGIAFLSGLIFFSLEVVWTQLIATVLGNSIYAFAAMLAMVLIGLGLGAALTVIRFPRERHIPTVEVGKLLLLGAILVALSSGLWQNVPDALTVIGGGFNSFGKAELLRWTVAAVLLVPPATVLGTVYPTLFRLEVFPMARSGRTAGRLIAANSIGSILGALATGFGLIPLLGSEHTLKLLTCLAFGAGLIVCLRFSGASRLWLAIAVAALALAILQPAWNRLKLTSGKQVYFADSYVGPRAVLRFFHEDTAGGFTTVIEDPGGLGPSRTLLTNGKFQGNDSSEIEAQTAFALAPMMFVQDFQDGLNIGLGTGRTAYTIGAMGFRSIHVAEIAPGIVQAADRWFSGINGRILNDPRTRLFVEDGRNVLLLRPEKYDLITLEISSVWFAGSTNLYSREFYQLARSHVKPGGVFQQWIQIHHIGINELTSVIATLRSVFPQVSFWVTGGVGIMVASDRPQQIQPAFLTALEQHHAAIGWREEELERLFQGLVGSRLLAPEDVSSICRRYQILSNTDRNRYLEYYTPRYNNVHLNFAVLNLQRLSQFASFPTPVLASGAAGRLAEAVRGLDREQYLRRLASRPQ